MQMDEILTASQVAALLQIHPRTVYKLVKRGSLPGRKFGGGWRFSKSEILFMVTPQSLATLQIGNQEGQEPRRGRTMSLAVSSAYVRCSAWEDCRAVGRPSH
jgi:excisionase family DNA binding protein